MDRITPPIKPKTTPRTTGATERTARAPASPKTAMNVAAKRRKAVDAPKAVRLPSPVAVDPAAEAIEDHIEAAVHDVTGRALDFEAFEAEFAANGALSERSYALLARAGVPRPVVDRHIEGRLAANELLRQELLRLTGGPERYARMMGWARGALAPRAFAALEASLSGPAEAVKAAIEDVSEMYAGATGDVVGGARAPMSPRPAPARPTQEMTDRPRAAAPASAPAPTAQRFASAEQLAKAIRDPRYRTDPAYRAWVAETVAGSDVFGRADRDA